MSTLYKELKNYIQTVKASNKKPKVLIVANIVGNFDWVYDYENYPSDEQGYTEYEIEAFSSCIRKLGFSIEIFSNEKEFFQYVINHSCKAELEDSILYNMAEGGKGPGQKALIPAFAKFYGIKVCNSSPHANSICHHKYHVNRLLVANSLPTPDSWLFNSSQFINGAPPEGVKVIVKPIYESMCLGVDSTSCFLWDDSKIDFIKNKSVELNQPMLIQKYIEGYEICCPVMKIQESKSLGIIGFGIDGNKYLTTDYKIFEGHKHHSYYSYIPDLSPKLINKIMRTAQETFNLLEMSGVGRIDFRVNHDEEIFIFDTNESPPPKKDTALYNTMKNLGLKSDEVLQAFFCISAVKLL